MRRRCFYGIALWFAAMSVAGCGGGGGGGGPGPVVPDTVVVQGDVAPGAVAAGQERALALPDQVRVSLVPGNGGVPATEVVTPTDRHFLLEVPAGQDYLMLFQDAAPGGGTLGALEVDPTTGRTTFSLPEGAPDVNLGTVTIEPTRGRATCGTPPSLPDPAAPLADDDGDGIPNVADDSTDQDADGVADADDPSPFDDGVIAAGVLNPLKIPKFTEPVILIEAMPQTPSDGATDYYELAVRQFEQQVLPPPMPKTPVWGFGSQSDPASFQYPALTIEATHGRPVRVKWINDLKDATGKPLPHLLPVDPMIHWANPIGVRDMAPPRDPTDPYWTNPYIDQATGRYIGPVPFVPHLHGIEVSQESDGYAEAWFLPAGSTGVNHTTGTLYDHFKASSPLGQLWADGAAVYEYPNDQRATTLWFHD
ncbi:MAG: hypothetical protein HY900_19090, partial [Deltaproteobacteria bacterium]|nr:hypothetical protein [Deltaproteobacteria bacterium]